MSGKVANIERDHAVARVSFVRMGADSGRRVQNMDVSYGYTATWRGHAVWVKLNADRYLSSPVDGEWRLTPWRVAISGTPYYVSDDVLRGDDVTETARDALAAAIVPFAEQWLISDAAKRSIRDAYYRECVQRLTDSSSMHGHGASEGFDLLQCFGDAMGPENVERFRPLAAAWQTWCEASAAAVAT